MKIFISWSGLRSHKVASLLNGWIQCVIQAVDPWLSSKDIDRGSLWFSEISNQLANTHNGIICLTKSNLNTPWILFEAGALAKGLPSSRVFTFLVDLNPSEIKDPLAQFNHTQPNKESVYQLLRSINNGLEEKALREEILSNVFETYWPQFEDEFNIILKDTPDEDLKVERPKDELLSEILYSVRAMDKRLRHIENVGSNSSALDLGRGYLPKHEVRRLVKEFAFKGFSSIAIKKLLVGKAPGSYLDKVVKEILDNQEDQNND